MRTKICFAAIVISLAITYYCHGEVEIEWVYIDDSGISGSEGFKGYMSKYETSNAQYCQFLNDALASGDITVGADNIVYGAFGSNDGADFVNETYYDLTGTGMTYDGATNGGAARINYNGSLFNVDAGFENHPVTYVSWYGSKAFCYYYEFRLPTDSEWQAVADYDGTYNYACGLSINNNIANYFNSIHPDGTTVVGSFGPFGYGLCDMTGNVWEWADNLVHDGVTKGGAWASPASYCEVSVYHTPYPLGFMHDSIGFRAVRSIDPIEEILDFIDESVEGGTLVPVKLGQAGEGQLNALRNMIEMAGDYIEAGQIADACLQLQAVFEKTDGLDPPESPPDFVKGPAAEELAEMIRDIMDNLGC